MSSLFVAPLIVFLIFVAPLWLILHYRSKKKMAHKLSEEDFQRLQTLSERAEQMQKRLDILERILDVETPSWRRRYE